MIPLLTMIPVRSQWGRYNLPGLPHIRGAATHGVAGSATFPVALSERIAQT